MGGTIVWKGGKGTYFLEIILGFPIQLFKNDCAMPKQEVLLTEEKNSNGSFPPVIELQLPSLDCSSKISKAPKSHTLNRDPYFEKEQHFQQTTHTFFHVPLHLVDLLECLSA